MQTDNKMMNDGQQPLELSAELRGEVLALFAPMDRSVADSVAAAISSHRSHRRLLQGLWLGFSPVIAVAIVAVLYVGGGALPRSSSMVSSKGAFRSPNPEIRAQDSAANVLAGSENVPALATACRMPSFRILLDGDAARKQLLATWLRARHPDVALMLDAAAPGSEVVLTLEPDEVREFAVLMALHGFIGEAPSGLLILPRFSPQSWSRSLGTSSLFICVTP
ncbi:MAG: hypothetical protein NTX94_03365 [Caldiserica bacterium]|nr:hypothetical protein [Caldisericota bacterium]